jgi:ribosomal protein S18 acetylase RimI-like enzyme
VALEAVLPADFWRRYELIRAATAADSEAILQIIEPVFRVGETYTVPKDISRADALAYWLADGHEVFVFEEAGQILGTYFLQANQRGGGAHVANCGYITAERATGRGIARAMCLHSLERAKERGFRAMQFNFVVSTNERAVKLWEGLGFRIVGRLPGAFLHSRLGYVDALVMFRNLSEWS